MDGIEALKAMKRGETIQGDGPVCRYRMRNGNIYHSGKKGCWVQSSIMLNTWMNKSFEIYTEPCDLTFLEAMAAVKAGKKVKSEVMDLTYYLDRTGNLVFKNFDGIEIYGSFSSDEVMAKWRVVE